MISFTPYKDGYAVADQFLQDVIWLRRMHNARPWLRRELGTYTTNEHHGLYTVIHPQVQASLETLGRPHNWHQLLLEVPHIPHSGDRAQVAYTRSDEHGQADRQTVTSLGKYLTRHWPHARSDRIRDLVAKAAAPKVEFLTTTAGIIWGIESGPRSCMKSDYGTIAFDCDHSETFRDHMDGDPTKTVDEEQAEDFKLDRHPYYVYAPSLGWSMAIMRRPGDSHKVFARALCWTDPSDPETKVFVRSYESPVADGSSQSSHGLEAQLATLGFARESGWPEECRVLNVDGHRGPLLPYIDGDNQYVARDWRNFRITNKSGAQERDGYECTNTDGSGDSVEEEYTWTCSDCGEGQTDDDDSTTVGRHGEDYVCDCCLNRHYTFVRGEVSRYYGAAGRWSNYSEYHVRDADAANVRGQDYSIDEDYPPESVVQLGNGTWAELDDSYCIDGEYYYVEDYRLVETEEECPDEGHRYALRENCWKDADGDWHQPHVEYAVVDGEKYLLDDCWQCAGDGAWYLNDDCDPVIDPETGDEVHPDWLAQINRDCLDEGGESYRQHHLPTTDMPTAERYEVTTDERYALID